MSERLFIKCEGFGDFPYLYVWDGRGKSPLCETCSIIGPAEFSAMLREQFASEHNELTERFRTLREEVGGPVMELEHDFLAAMSAQQEDFAIATFKVVLRSPVFWDAVAQRIGDNDHEYDLGDASHRLDVVQIVCEAASRAWGE